MKTKLIFLSLFTIFISSCSHNDTVVSDTTDPADLTPTTYYPLTTANYWKYKVSAQGTDSNDILTIGNNLVINSNTYQKMIGSADPSGQANGFYTTTLNNNNLRRDGSSIKLTGAINFAFPGLSTPIAININDFTIFKQNGTNGTELSSVTGTLTQDVAISATQQLPLTFEYKFRSVAGDNLASFASNNNSYTNVKQSKLILSLKITTTQTITGVPTPVTVTLMDTQDVSTSTLHFVNNLGMVYNNTLFSYHLSDAATQVIPATSPIPATMSVTQEEFLESFHIN